MRLVLLVVAGSVVAGCTVLPLLGIPAAEVFYRVDIEAEGGKKKEEK